MTDSPLNRRLDLTAQRRNALSQARDKLKEASRVAEELARLTREDQRRELGIAQADHLEQIASELLGGGTEAVVPLHLLLSALERAWQTGRFHAQGGTPGPAPVTPQEGTAG